jgi:hypothetical protein
MTATPPTTWVENNIRQNDLQRVIEEHKKDGWTFKTFAQVSGPGHVGITFTAVFEKDKP